MLAIEDEGIVDPVEPTEPTGDSVKPTENPEDNPDNEYFKQQELSINEAKAKVDEIRNDEEMEQAKEDSEVIEQAMESLQTLMVYRDALKANSNISTESFNTAIRHVTAVRADFGYNSERLQQLKNNEYDRGIAVESIVESIKAFFRAIQNYLVTLFNKIKEWISKFFKAYTDYNHRFNKSIEAASQAILNNRKKVKRASDGKIDLSDNKPNYVQLDIPERKFLTINTKQPEDYSLDFKSVLHLVRPDDTKTMFDTCEKMFGGEYFDLCNKAMAGMRVNTFDFDPVRDTAVREKPIGNYKGIGTPYGFRAVINGPFLGDIGFVTQVRENKELSSVEQLFESVMAWDNNSVVMTESLPSNMFRNVRNEEIEKALDSLRDMSGVLSNAADYFEKLNGRCFDMAKYAKDVAEANPSLIDPNNAHPQATTFKLALTSVNRIPDKIRKYAEQRMSYVSSVASAWLKYLQEIAKLENPSGN